MNKSYKIKEYHQTSEDLSITDSEMAPIDYGRPEYLAGSYLRKVTVT